VNRRKARVFIDTNMLIFAMQYHKENVFEWIELLYGNVWIHMSVLAELLQGRAIVEREIRQRNWQIFDTSKLTANEKVIYASYVAEIKNAFRQMNLKRAAQGKRAKNTADIGEIATLAVCLLEDAQLICSDDADIQTVVRQEQYSYIDVDGAQHLIAQNSAEDFCVYCVTEAGVAKSKVRHFYKTLFEDTTTRAYKLAALDDRFGE